MEVKYRDIAQDIARKAVDGSLDLDEFNALVEEQRRELIRKRDHLIVKDETYELIQKLPEYRQHYKGPVKKNLERLQVDADALYVYYVYKANISVAKQKEKDFGSKALCSSLTLKKAKAMDSTVRFFRKYMGFNLEPPSPVELFAVVETLDTLKQEMPKFYSQLKTQGKRQEKAKANDLGMEL